MIWTAHLSESPVCGVTWRTKAMRLPSGDQDTGDAGELGGSTQGSDHEPEVCRRATPPSDDTSHRWTGIGASFVNISSLPTSKASSPFSMSFLFGASSAAVKAISVPSGRQEYCWTEVGDF